MRRSKLSDERVAFAPPLAKNGNPDEAMSAEGRG